LRKLEPALLVKVGKSSSVWIYLLLLHVLSFVSVMLISSVLWLKVGLLIAISISTVFYYYRYQSDYNGFSIKHSSEFAWQWFETGQEPVTLTILKSTVITQWGIVLHVQIDKNYRYFLILADSVDSESYRKLQVRLKIDA